MIMCGWSFRGGIEETGTRRCGGLYIPFVPPSQPPPHLSVCRRLLLPRADRFRPCPYKIRPPCRRRKVSALRRKQPLSAACGNKRYNTLDFAEGKIVCQQGCSRPYWKPSAEGLRPSGHPRIFSLLGTHMEKMLCFPCGYCRSKMPRGRGEHSAQTLAKFSPCPAQHTGHFASLAHCKTLLC